MSGTYELCQRLGAGGMGEVLLGRDVRTAGAPRLVAIKRMHAHLAEDPTRRAMFLEEARLAARVRHPNVVATLDVVDDPSSPWIVMDYVDGASLASLLAALREKREPLPQAVAIAIVADVLAGLHAAHETTDDQGRPLALVHRDVSPHNVLIGRDGVSRVIDFGIARASDRAIETKTGEVKGKLAYMPPEQLRGRNVTRRADLYAVAAVLWECLTARRFRDGSDGEVVEQILLHDVDPPSRFAADVSIALDDAVLRGLAASPDQRYATGAEMAAALSAVVAPAPPAEVARVLAATLADELAAHTELTTRIASAPGPVTTATERRRLPGLAVLASAGFLGACIIAAATIARPTAEIGTRGEVASAISTSSVSPPAPAREADPLDPAPAPLPTATAKLASAPRRVVPKKSAPAPSPDPCKVPFEIDEEGNRHYKRECLK